MDDELMHITQAARVFGINRDTMSAWMKDPRRGFVTGHDQHGTRKVTRASVNQIAQRVGRPTAGSEET